MSGNNIYLVKTKKKVVIISLIVRLYMYIHVLMYKTYENTHALI